jgi:rubrerythrin
MKKPRTIGELNDLAIALEHSVELLYRELAVMFAHEPEVAQFWTLMANEEVGHAKWLEELRNSLEEHQLRKQVDSRFSEAAWTLLQTSPKARLRIICWLLGHGSSCATSLAFMWSG